ncbi:MAG: hypothetical protein ACXWDO_06710 [Bacteroidia bacterium]
MFGSLEAFILFSVLALAGCLLTYWERKKEKQKAPPQDPEPREAYNAAELLEYDKNPLFLYAYVIYPKKKLNGVFGEILKYDVFRKRAEIRFQDLATGNYFIKNIPLGFFYKIPYRPKPYMYLLKYLIDYGTKNKNYHKQ